MDAIPSIWSKPPELLLLSSKSRNKQHPTSSIAHQILPANPSWINTWKTVVETEEIQTGSCKQEITLLFACQVFPAVQAFAFPLTV